MMEFNIEEINENNVIVNSACFDMADFRSSFIPAFCCTVYKYQGASIKEQYNIYDVNRMEKKQHYPVQRNMSVYISMRSHYHHFMNHAHNQV